ncbi:MAG: hypothetical protein N3A38_15950, partial [Planctomycetota bacterium]|nr:hypothetical protein [Planctomycetota bacterium]
FEWEVESVSGRRVKTLRMRIGQPAAGPAAEIPAGTADRERPATGETGEPRGEASRGTTGAGQSGEREET